MTIKIAARILVGSSRIKLHHTRGISDGFHTGKREHDTNEGEPVLTERSVQRLEVSKRFTDMGQTKKSERDHDDDRWDRNQEGETSRLLRP
jgi:hypothetical protein